MKINKYTCEETLKRKKHVTFILCPQSTITQWMGEIELIEKGVGHTEDDYRIIVIDKTKVLMDFYKNHCKVKKDKIIFDKNKIDKPTYILCGKEAFKLSQVRRPAFNISFDMQMKPILKCPNCGKPLVVYKKPKRPREEVLKIAMGIDDFYTGKGDKLTKSLKSSNVFCETCTREMNDYDEFITNEIEMKNAFENYSMVQYPSHFIPKDKNIWSLEYNSVNKFIDKIYNKISNTKDIDNKYTTFKSIKDMQEMLDARIKLREDMSKKLNLRQLNVSKNNSKKVSVIEFLRKRKFDFDSVIIDEAHEGNNANSLIGTAQRLLFKFAKKVILLSGTANNGYASSLHNLLMAAMPNKLIEDGTFEKADFIRKYGIQKGVIKVDEHGKVSGRVDLPTSAFKEVEGINPVVFAKFLSKNFIMVNTLQELDLPMPNLIEKYVPIEPDRELMNTYDDFYVRVEQANVFMAKMLKASIFKNYINNPYNWKPVEISVDGGSVEVLPQVLDREKIPYLTKDYELLEIIKQEKSEGRKCFLFTDFAEGGKYINTEEIKGKTKEIKYTINDRICELLKANGITYMVLQANTTSVSNRRNFIEEKKDEYDVFICQPQLVNVGLNLVFCPTYIVYTPFYKYDIISQATRRGYRANSTEENRIFHLYYSQTCEEDIIDRYQRKLAEAKAIEGEFFVNIEQGKNLRTLSKMSDEIVKN